MRPYDTITSVRFRNFKAMRDFSLRLSHLNVLVGPNNCGKSTILGAFRVLSAGIRRAASKSSSIVTGPDGPQQGYPISPDELPISLENVHSDYSDKPSTVTFRSSSGRELALFFRERADGVMIMPERDYASTRPSLFRELYPVAVGVVPVLGPVEHEEELLLEQTVVRGLSTHRASRHFRNYWYYHRESFDEFRKLVEESWPGMSVNPPEVSEDREVPRLAMFCRENRIDRELYWVGFGFQIWCQLLTHILRAKNDSLLIIDEPEIYLHPDLQRQLLRIVRDIGPDVILATHSTEIVSEAEPGDIVLIDKARQSAQRVRDIDGVQNALDFLGSGVNVTLAQLARTRRVLFVEGADFKLLRAFADRVGLSELAAGDGLTAVPVEGFSNWKRVAALGWGIERTLGRRMAVAAVFDRDYFCDDEIDGIVQTLAAQLAEVRIHRRKEIENYLLVPAVLQRAAERAANDRARRTGGVAAQCPSVVGILETVTASVMDQVRSQIVGRYVAHWAGKAPNIDSTTLTGRALELFDSNWKNLDSRLKMVPGKDVFSAFNEQLRSLAGVSLSPSAVVNSMRRDEVPDDLQETLAALDRFRRQLPPSS